MFLTTLLVDLEWDILIYQDGYFNLLHSYVKKIKKIGKQSWMCVKTAGNII